MRFAFTDAKLEPVTKKSGGRKSSSRETTADEIQANGKKIKVEPDANGQTAKSGSGKSQSGRKKSRREMEMEGKEIGTGSFNLLTVSCDVSSLCIHHIT